jgi:regulator of protease activity HflC (stomatin/prohibitin superfamily)
MSEINRPRMILMAVGGVVAVVVLWIILSKLFVTVEAGNVGVVSTFGKVEEEPIPAGLHTLAPWCTVHSMSVRSQQNEQKNLDALTADGASINIDASLFFSVNPEKASQVFRNIGPEGEAGYLPIIVSEFRGAVRRIIANYKAEALYSEKRQGAELEAESYMKEALEKRGFRCEKVIFRSVQLPKQVTDSIHLKMTAEQKSEQMKYELMTAEQEAKKKLIEAKAIAESQELIKKSLDDTYIRYLWVQALETAAKNRSATIYVPTGKDGLPMVSTVSTGTPTKDK